MDLYERAIHSARANGFVHQEALAHELAGCFYLQRGFETAGFAHLRHARACYALWGADGKVRQLDELYPHLRQAEPGPDARRTIGAPIEHLELTTVLNVSQAVSGELVLDKLVETLLRTAIEHAGAERGVLIEPRGEALWIRAEGSTSGSAVRIVLRDVPLDSAALPESVVRYAARVHETVNLDDASTHNEFSNDEYIRRAHAKSVLCLPLLQQGRLMAVLYLENNLAARVFTPARMAVLNVLAAQAAMSLEKSRLFRELQHREAKIRRLFEANIIGIFIYDLDGRITDANDAFLRIVGYDRDDLVSGRLRWTDLTPPEWLERNQRINLPQLQTFGVVQPFEKEYFRKDGSRVPVLIGGANFEEQVREGVAFVLDLSERKRAEEALRRSEAYLAEAQRLTHTGSYARDAKTLKAHYCSEEDLRIWGSEQHGAPSLEMVAQRIHPDDLDSFMEQVEKARDDGTDFEIDFRIVLPDGTLKYIHSINHWAFDAGGNVIELIGTHVDVTERKRAEEEREQLRMRHLAREFELSLEARVAERTRIARELHDTLLQTFFASLLEFKTAWNLFPTHPEEARQVFDRAIDHAEKAITEGRDAVQGLRSSVRSVDGPDDLVAAIETLGKELAADPSTNRAASLRVDMEGPVRPLHPNVRGEIYRIACEALRNAFQHSQATQIEVELRYEEEQFRLRVRDDGKGIDAKVLADGRREGHYGLCGMRERADLIGAKLALRSGPDAGTEVELTLAVSHAYLKTSRAAFS